jgi:uncharacterized alkaline shock family protein YloU
MAKKTETPESTPYCPPVDKPGGGGDNLGAIEISRDVIASIASQAARKVEGIQVVASSFSLSEIFGGGKESVKGVAVVTNEESGHVEINLEVNVTYGVSVYEAASQLQHIVKEEVEALTGYMNVDRVNVRVRSLVMPADQVTERAPVSPDRAVDGRPLEDEVQD